MHLAGRQPELVRLPSAEDDIYRVESLQPRLGVLAGMTVMRSDFRGGMTIVIGTQVADQHAPVSNTAASRRYDSNSHALPTKASA